MHGAYDPSRRQCGRFGEYRYPAVSAFAHRAGVGCCPNNGQPLQESSEINEGEISKLFGNPFEVEFRDVVPDAISNQFLRNQLRGQIEAGGDASVLSFEITTTSPGFLVVSFVYASDEEPDWTDDFNDIAAIIVEEDGQAPVNILTFRKRIDPQTLVTRPLTLIDLSTCPTLARLNDVAPNPPILDGTLHSTGNEEFFDHEFSIFTPVLTRITGDDPATELEIEREPLRPGTHRIKLIVHDVRDQLVDAALFVPEDGIRFMAVLPADFNLDGTVDAQDLNIYAANEFGPGKFTDGDANFDGVVNTEDLDILNDHYLESGGFAMQSADFNYDGVVDDADLDILNLHWLADDCISRLEGDTDDDGDVDIFDLTTLGQSL